MGTVGWCDTLSVLVGVFDVAMVFVVIAGVVYFTKQKQFDACWGRIQDETVGQRRRTSLAREADERRVRMDSADVKSFTNPSLDVETVNATPELTIEWWHEQVQEGNNRQMQHRL